MVFHLSGGSSIGRLANDGGVSDPLVATEHVPVEPDSLQTVPDEEVDHLGRRRAHYDVALTVLVTFSTKAQYLILIHLLYRALVKCV